MSSSKLLQKPPTSFGRKLKSFEPDLEVVVGPEEKVFYYHSRILASYSAYIDTMLSVDMRERATKRITFPDISPEIWTKMMHFHEPGGSRAASVDDYMELVPLFDKYEFHVGLDLIDRGAPGIFRYDDIVELLALTNDPILPRFAVLCYEYNLPRSKGEAIEFAKLCLLGANRTEHLGESGVRLLLPLLRDEEKALKLMLGTVMGREDITDDMNIESLREITQEESFAAKYIARDKHISLQGRIYAALKVEQVRVGQAGDDIANGEYKPKRENGGYGRDFFGAMGVYYVKKIEDELLSVFIESLDPFGKRWQIRLKEHEDEVNDANDEEEEEDGDDDDADKQRTLINIIDERVCGEVLYTWQSDYSTLLPPKFGWSAAADTGVPAPKLDYYVDSYR